MGWPSTCFSGGRTRELTLQEIQAEFLSSLSFVNLLVKLGKEFDIMQKLASSNKTLGVLTETDLKGAFLQVKSSSDFRGWA